MTEKGIKRQSVAFARFCGTCRPIAQLVEQRSPKPQVGGSSPSWPANHRGTDGRKQQLDRSQAARLVVHHARLLPRDQRGDEEGHLAGTQRGAEHDCRRAHRHGRLRGLPVGLRRRLLQGDRLHLHQVRIERRRVRQMVEATAQKQWYIVNTYSGFEERVKENLQQRIDALGMREKFGEIKIPTETLVEMKSGKKREVQRKFFPGYILVEMEMSDDAWHLVKNTPKVTGFVGTGKKPTPLTQEEVEQILTQVVTTKEKPKPKHVYEHGEHVRIIDGPFTNFTGVVEEVNLDRSTLKVMVTIFGRSTPVELDFLQVNRFDPSEEQATAPKRR